MKYSYLFTIVSPHIFSISGSCVPTVEKMKNLKPKEAIKMEQLNRISTNRALPQIDVNSEPNIVFLEQENFSSTS